MKISLLIIIYMIVKMEIGTSLPTSNATYNESTALIVRSENVKREKRQTTVQYYDFLITEASFKFWTVLELVTCAILLYSTFAAIYYARFVYLNPSQDPDKDYEADLLTRRAMDGRSLGQGQHLEKLLSILDAISKPPENSLDKDFDD